MIFGIKTKKDKEIERLRECIYQVPHITLQQGNVIELAARQTLEEGMPVDYVKRKIAQRFVDKAMEFVKYDLVQEGRGGKALEGRIKIVTYGTGSEDPKCQ